MSGIRKLQIAVVALLLCSLVSCSPLYVIRAGWEEAGILLRRQDIQELLEKPETDPALRETLQEVVAARIFAKELGLKPKGSFTQYSEIDRDVLVWVLSASPKDSLSFTTWWFPIVGSVPYKGFFEKEDGLEEARELKENGFDIFLRPSVAFSTLGWFNDPLLSTMKNFDKVSLVNTVIHEILHNTIWIPGDATFNETMANLVGAIGAISYFEKNYGVDSELAQTARDRWYDEQRYAAFIHALSEELKEFYKSAAEKKMPLEELLRERKALFESAGSRWNEQANELRTKRYKTSVSRWNNAVVLAQTIYLDRLDLFADLYQKCHESLTCFREEAKAIEAAVEEREVSAFEVLSERLQNLPAQQQDGKMGQ